MGVSARYRLENIWALTGRLHRRLPRSLAKRQNLRVKFSMSPFNEKIILDNSGGILIFLFHFYNYFMPRLNFEFLRP